MAAASTYLEDALINHTLRPGNAYTAPTVLYVALFATDAGLEGGIITSELTTDGGYVRKSATFAAPVDGVSSNSIDVTYDVASANWSGEVTHVAIMDSLLAGSDNVLYHGQLTTPKTVTSGDTFKFTAGDLTVSIA